MAKRKSLSVRVRFEVLKRDRFTCQYCGRHPPDVLLDVDHRVPVAAGGSNDPSNLVAACKACNGGKSDRLLVEGEFPVPSAESLEDRKERLRQGEAYAKLVADERALDDKQVDLVVQEWAKVFHAQDVIENGKRFWRFGPGEWFPLRAKIRKYLKQLPLEEVLHAIDITAVKIQRSTEDAENYFFGVCWHKARAREAELPAPPSPTVAPVPTATVDPSARAPAESGVFESREAEGQWFACSPGVNEYGAPYNYPEWWDWKTRGHAPELWLESPVEYQEHLAWDEAYPRYKADAGQQPDPFLSEPHEPTIRNPQWVRYWRKYGYTQAREFIRDRWGREGLGSYPCVRRPRPHEVMSEAARRQIREAFIAHLMANARPPWKPLRVSSIQYDVLLAVSSPEDVFLDEWSGVIGMRVRINDKVMASIEAVVEDGYEAVAYYANVDEWKPPGESLADFHAAARQAG